MKLLLDQNISHKLVTVLDPVFFGTLHVKDIDLDRSSDSDIWNYAKENNFIIVTQDSDFSERVTLYSHPPKVIWLRMFNTSTETIKNILLEHVEEIVVFLKDDSRGCLLLG